MSDDEHTPLASERPPTFRYPRPTQHPDRESGELVERLRKWHREMDRSAQEMALIPELREAAIGSGTVAKCLSDAADLITRLTKERDEAREALRALLARDMRNTCRHEETYRRGFIWEICHCCGKKWAGDEGGKPEWVDPPEWGAARSALRSGNGD